MYVLVLVVHVLSEYRYSFLGMYLTGCEFVWLESAMKMKILLIDCTLTSPMSFVQNSKVFLILIVTGDISRIFLFYLNRFCHVLSLWRVLKCIIVVCD